MNVQLIARTNFVILDFDGVIKESLELKSHAFEYLFLPFGEDVAKRVRCHHEQNGGMSRYEKFTIYLDWAKQQRDSEAIKEYSKKFSDLVKDKVISCNWVPGAREFIENQSKYSKLFLVTATPQGEIEEIAIKLKIKEFFTSIIGAPTSKMEALALLMLEYKIPANQAVMIGDSMSDYLASVGSGVPFILRKTAFNKGMQNAIDCPMIVDFL